MNFEATHMNNYKFNETHTFFLKIIALAYDLLCKSATSDGSLRLAMGPTGAAGTNQTHAVYIDAIHQAPNPQPLTKTSLDCRPLGDRDSESTIHFDLSGSNII